MSAVAGEKLLWFDESAFLLRSKQRNGLEETKLSREEMFKSVFVVEHQPRSQKHSWVTRYRMLRVGNSLVPSPVDNFIVAELSL